METPYRFDDWFLHNWSRAALPLAVVVGLLSPLIFKAYGVTALLVALHLVIYMVHQYEEHAHGKFKAFTNQFLAGGQPKIGDAPIFWVNIVGVWGIYLVVIYGAIVVNPALGLISAYTTVVNGLLHIIASIVTRRYNPGLITSLILFLPIGAYTVWVISQSPDTTSSDHVLGIAAAVIIHLLTFGYLGRIARR